MRRICASLVYLKIKKKRSMPSYEIVFYVHCIYYLTNYLLRDLNIINQSTHFKSNEKLYKNYIISDITHTYLCKVILL